MAKVIAITNQKGGVGKTTTSVNLAASLAVGEKSTLLIDFDPQGNATSAVGIDPRQIRAGKTVYEALIGEVSFPDVIIGTEMDNLSLAPSNNHLAGAEIELVSMFARENKFKSSLEPIRDQYDYILIDCPPSLGLLTINALTAADSILIPLQCEYFALEGLSQLMQTATLVRAQLNPTLEDEGILLTMYDGRNRLSQEIEKEVRTHFGELVFDTVVPRNVRLSECASHGKPVLLYDIHSKGCSAYLHLAKEILARNQPNPEPPPFTGKDFPLTEHHI